MASSFRCAPSAFHLQCGSEAGRGNRIIGAPHGATSRLRRSANAHPYTTGGVDNCGAVARRPVGAWHPRARTGVAGGGGLLIAVPLSLPLSGTGLLCATIRLGAARRADLGTILGAHSCLDAARTGNVNGLRLDFVRLRPPPSHPASQSTCAWLKRRGGPRGVPLRADQCPAHQRLRFSPATATLPEATDGRDTTLRSRLDGVFIDSGSGAEPSNRTLARPRHRPPEPTPHSSPHHRSTLLPATVRILSPADVVRVQAALVSSYVRRKSSRLDARS